MAVSGVKLKTLPAVTVTTAGTRVAAYTANLMVYGAIITNVASTGTQYWGDSTVSSSNGTPMVNDGSISIEPPPLRGVDQFNIKDIYLDSTTNNASFRIAVWIRE